MSDIIVLIALLCLFGCEIKLPPINVDGVQHEFVINPSKDRVP